MPSDNRYDASCHLSWGDVAVDVIPLTQLEWKCIGKVPCIGHVGIPSDQGQRSGSSLHVFQWKTPHKTITSDSCQGGLDRAGVESGHYSGHSIHIGAATTAAARGLQDSMVQTLRRWKSLAYLARVH